MQESLSILINYGRKCKDIIKLLPNRYSILFEILSLKTCCNNALPHQTVALLMVDSFFACAMGKEVFSSHLIHSTSSIVISILLQLPHLHCQGVQCGVSNIHEFDEEPIVPCV